MNQSTRASHLLSIPTEIVRAEQYVGIFVQQPGRETAHIALGTNVRSRAQYNVQAGAIGQLEEVLDVRHSLPVVHILLWVVQGPFDVPVGEKVEEKRS